MNLDLLAGTLRGPAALPPLRPTILVLDSGLGGLTVLAELARSRPDAGFVYAADDAAFPYGDWPEAPLVARVEALVARLCDRFRPHLVVVACNTISTLVLPALRARFDLPFVGTVPAIKPAVAASRTGRVCVLATPGTVRRDYTRELIAAYAGTCRVDLVGSSDLARLAEAELSGTPAPDAALWREVAPCFPEDGGPRTDAVALACTHYPLLRARLERLAPWPVTWIDPAPAVARRVVALLGPAPAEAHAAAEPGIAVFTGAGRRPEPVLRALRDRGLPNVEGGLLPLG